MKIVLITDTHFGVKNNSPVWFRSQRDFIYHQVIPKMIELRDQDDIMLVHLGDVFDSRSSIHTRLAADVRDLFCDLAAVCPVVIIPGNHDYYSESTSYYCTPQLILKDIPDVHIVSDQEVCTWGSRKVRLMPWPSQKEVMDWNAFARQHVDEVIFTHADLVSPAINNLPLRTPVFTGHIHTPLVRGNLRNLGSCYPLNFFDSNQDRYFYVWDPDQDGLEPIANGTSIRFWRWKGLKEVMDEDSVSGTRDNDYVELYVPQEAMSDPGCQEQIKKFREKTRNVFVIPLGSGGLDNPAQLDLSLDMDSLVRQHIPPHLEDKYNHILDKIKNNQEE